MEIIGVWTKEEQERVQVQAQGEEQKEEQEEEVLPYLAKKIIKKHSRGNFASNNN